MKKIILLLALLVFGLNSCGTANYYNEPRPISISTNMAEHYFLMQAPLILEGMGYEEEEINEESATVLVSKFVEANNNKLKLYFKMKYNNDQINITPYFINNDVKKYIDKNRFPKKIEKVFLSDLERFITISKNQSFPNRP